MRIFIANKLFPRRGEKMFLKVPQNKWRKGNTRWKVVHQLRGMSDEIE